MEGVLASGLTPGHSGHRAQPCPRVPGLGLFLQLPLRIRVPVVTPWLRAKVALCVRESVCLLASGTTSPPPAPFRRGLNVAV